jgi:hypothetical protein
LEPPTYQKPYGDPQKKKKEEAKIGERGRVKVEGWSF